MLDPAYSEIMNGNAEAVSISNNGNTIAIAKAAFVNGLGDVGAIHVLDWNGMKWIRRGDVIYGEERSTIGGFEGKGLSLTEDGNTVVFGTPYGYGNDGWKNGCALVFNLLNGKWVKKGGRVDGPARTSGYFSGELGQTGWLGASAAINSTGNVIILGAPLGFGYGKGSWNFPECKYPNPTPTPM